MEIKIFATTQKEYEKNGNDAKGIDLVLPMDNNDLENLLICFTEGDVDNIHNPDYWTIVSFEYDFIANIKLAECTDIFAINNMAQQIEDLSSYDEERLASIMDGMGYNSIYEILEYLEKLDNVIFYPNMSLRDVANNIIEEHCALPETTKRYFDFDAYASDLGYEGYIETKWGVIYEQTNIADWQNCEQRIKELEKQLAEKDKLINDYADEHAILQYKIASLVVKEIKAEEFAIEQLKKMENDLLDISNGWWLCFKDGTQYMTHRELEGCLKEVINKQKGEIENE